MPWLENWQFHWCKLIAGNISLPWLEVCQFHWCRLVVGTDLVGNGLWPQVWQFHWCRLVVGNALCLGLRFGNSIGAGDLFAIAFALA